MIPFCIVLYITYPPPPHTHTHKEAWKYTVFYFSDQVSPKGPVQSQGPIPGDRPLQSLPISGSSTQGTDRPRSRCKGILLLECYTCQPLPGDTGTVY